MIIPDLNVLTYAHNSSASHHERARSWWERTISGSEPVGIPWIVVLGSSVCSRIQRSYPTRASRRRGTSLG